MSRERWGTFSVIDHQRHAAFVAEVLLYDRLIIPYPPNFEERKRWSERKWRPDLLDAKLEILGEEMALRVPWGEWAQERFKTRFEVAKRVSYDGENLVNEQGNTDGFYGTRMILAQDCRPELPKGVTKVWALAAYPSLNAYQEDRDKPEEEPARETLAMVLTNKFIVPNSPGKSDDELLKQAVQLAGRDDFKEKRAKFHRWQEDIIEEGIPPLKAVEEMEAYLKQFEDVAKKAKTEVYWRFAFMAIPVAVSMVTAGLGMPLVAAGASGLISLAAFSKFDRKPKIDAGDCEAAAMIHDVNQNFKWG